MTAVSGSRDRALAVVYLARGADAEAELQFGRFVTSYLKFRSGIEHQLFVVLKGFPNTAALKQAIDIFGRIDCLPIEVDDDNFDIGAYAAAAAAIPCDDICFLNTNSEILSEYWLAKLSTAHRQPHVGLVSATGSYESLWPLYMNFPRFPNIHVRSNAFILSRELAIRLLPRQIRDKKSAYEVESGSDSLTRQILELGLAVEVVGRNGRSYPPQWWPASATFRQGKQGNLLIHDNQTRLYEALPWPEKQAVHDKTWGHYVKQSHPFVLPAEA